MKTLSISIVLAAILTSALPSRPSLDTPYSPSRKEWLEVVVFKAVKESTDSWEQRIASKVDVNEREYTILVTLISANGQDPLNADVRAEYVRWIKLHIESLVNRYEWVQGWKVSVQFA